MKPVMKLSTQAAVNSNNRFVGKCKVFAVVVVSLHVLPNAAVHPLLFATASSLAAAHAQACQCKPTRTCSTVAAHARTDTFRLCCLLMPNRPRLLLSHVPGMKCSAAVLRSMAKCKSAKEFMRSSCWLPKQQGTAGLLPERAELLDSLCRLVH